MGLSEILGLGANVVLKLKADTSDAKAKIRELSGEEKKAAEAALKLVEAENKALDSKAKRYQFAAQAIGGVSAAIGIGKSALEAYAKTSTMAANEAKRFQEVGSKAYDTVMSSIGKVVLATEPLVKAFSGLVESLGDIGVLGPAAIGALGLAVTGNPAVAGALTLLAFATDGKTDAADALRNPGAYMRQKAAARNQALIDATNTINSLDPATGRLRNKVDDAYIGLGKLEQALGGAVEYGLRRVGIDKWNPLEARKGSGERNVLDPDQLGTYGSRYRLGAGSGSTGRAASYSNAGLDSWQAQQSAAFRAGSRGLMQPWAQQGEGIRNAQESQLSKVFGPLTEFSAYAAAFDTLSGAIGSALGAWIDGSMSAGKAFKAFIAEAVKGLAVQMTIEALKHGAYAIGSLAMGNFAGAAMHGKAAAGFAAGAVVAAAAAKGLASGGAASSGGGYSPSAPSTLGGSSAQQNAAPVIVVGSPYAYDSPRNQQRTARRLVAMVTGTSAVEYG